MLLPKHLDSDRLEVIVEAIQQRMYLDEPEKGRYVWNPDKEWDGADLCQDIAAILHQYELVPERGERYVEED